MLVIYLAIQQRLLEPEVQESDLRAIRTKLKNEHKTIYSGLSATTHGNSALKNVAIEKAILPLRGEDKTNEVTPLPLGRAFLLGAIAYMILNYDSHQARQDEFEDFLKEHIDPTVS
jgi:hypothetical protein